MLPWKLEGWGLGGVSVEGGGGRVEGRVYVE
jgi:hypothetical protein